MVFLRSKKIREHEQRRSRSRSRARIVQHAKENSRRMKYQKESDSLDTMNREDLHYINEVSKMTKIPVNTLVNDYLEIKQRYPTASVQDIAQSIVPQNFDLSGIKARGIFTRGRSSLRRVKNSLTKRFSRGKSRTRRRKSRAQQNLSRENPSGEKPSGRKSITRRGENRAQQNLSREKPSGEKPSRGRGARIRSSLGRALNYFS